jgi:hypothetical protein
VLTNHSGSCRATGSLSILACSLLSAACADTPPVAAPSEDPPQRASGDGCVLTERAGIVEAVAGVAAAAYA